MKKLSEHNKEVLNRVHERERQKTRAGVCCTECGCEMVLTHPGRKLLTYPPKEAVHCPKCGFKGYKY